MVLGPVEFAAAPLVRSLQRRLWAAAGVDSKSREPQRPVWLSRRHQHRRYLANSDAIEAMAQRLGFEVVVPESLSLVDQVRLCAHASAIAGPEGANLTNLMFARPGTRVLGLVPENNNYPTFVDLCAVADLPQRWIFGRTDPRKSWWGGYHEPFEVDMAVLERELQWLVGTR
jgi:capsular polysaccharide biosynthesis protein